MRFSQSLTLAARNVLQFDAVTFEFSSLGEWPVF